MQLGELQNQIERFARRNATVVAISVDAPTDSLAMIERLGLTFPLASDPDQRVVKQFAVQNPDTQELALHAVYIVDTQGEIFYRKVARRRPVSAELIDAIDYQQGTWPRTDPAAPRQRIAVAYPQNNFQAIVEVAKVSKLPGGVDATAFAELQRVSGDKALFAFKRLIEASLSSAHRQRMHTGTPSRQTVSANLYATAAWLIRGRFFADNAAAIKAGEELDRRLQRVRALEQEEVRSRGSADHDANLHTLAAARAGLSRAQATINSNAQDWNLRYAKASLRSYREVVRAAIAATSTAG